MSTKLLAGVVYPKQIQQGKWENNKNTNKDALYLSPSGFKTSKQAAFGEYEFNIKTSNEFVIRHEMTHQSFAGRMAAGSPKYVSLRDKDNREVYIAGSQSIKPLPKYDSFSPLKDISFAAESAKLVMTGAEAPASFSPLSGADIKIAASAKNKISQTQKAMSFRYYLQNAFGINPEKQINHKELQQAQEPKINQTGKKLDLIA